MSQSPPMASFQRLLAALRSMERVLVAFSGGVDSTFLLHAAVRALGTEGVLAVTLSAPYMAISEMEEGTRVARAMGVRHERLPVPFLEAIRRNPPERCYLCKRELFSRLLETAAREGIGHVLDGTNIDDMGDHRPGIRALRELGVESPLLAAGLGKGDIRTLAREEGLAVWNTPAAACLLTRLPHGVPVVEAELRRIELGETLLKNAGFASVRLRIHGDVARIEVPRGEIAALVAADAREDVAGRIAALGYRHVAVDLAGYRMGSLNETAAPTQQD